MEKNEAGREGACQMAFVSWVQHPVSARACFCQAPLPRRAGRGLCAQDPLGSFWALWAEGVLVGTWWCSSAARKPLLSSGARGGAVRRCDSPLDLGSKPCSEPAWHLRRGGWADACSSSCHVAPQARESGAHHAPRVPHSGGPPPRRGPARGRRRPPRAPSGAHLRSSSRTRPRILRPGPRAPSA